MFAVVFAAAHVAVRPLFALEKPLALLVVVFQAVQDVLTPRLEVVEVVVLDPLVPFPVTSPLVGVQRVQTKIASIVAVAVVVVVAPVRGRRQ